MSYIVDKRLDASAPGIKTLVSNYIDTLLTFNIFQNSPYVTSSSMFVSVLTSNGLAILDEDTAIGPAGIVIGQGHGQWQFNYLSVASETGYSNPSVVLLVGSSLAADDGKSFPVFGGGTSHLTLGRILFHELTHLIFDWSKDTILGIQFEEELAVSIWKADQAAGTMPGAEVATTSSTSEPPFAESMGRQAKITSY